MIPTIVCLVLAVAFGPIMSYLENKEEKDRQGKSDSPAIYEWAMKRMRGSKLDTVVFEDVLFAIRTAKEAGFRVAAVYDRDSEEEQGEIKALADYYITSFEELYEAQTLG